MAKIKFTKGELKKQRDSLKQFRHYLPTLLLKKQQLQMKILEIKREWKKKDQELKNKEESIKEWVGLLADPGTDISGWVAPHKVLVEETNVAGANIPIFKEVVFDLRDYDYYQTPFWIDEGIASMKGYVTLMVELEIIRKQIEKLEHELRITTQRVNLFEKIKIPECIENIRKITIYLGDQMANAVGISKVAKKKIEQSSLEELALA